MKYTNYIKICFTIAIFGIAFANRVNAQKIIYTNDREPGRCTKVDSLGHAYYVIYMPAPNTESTEQNKTVNTADQPERLDTSWVEPKLMPMSRKLQMLHNNTIDTLHKEVTHNNVPANVKKVPEQPK
jgi:hypothetical protein